MRSGTVYILLFMAFAAGCLVGFGPSGGTMSLREVAVSDNAPVEEVLISLGEKPLVQHLDSYDTDKAEMGRQLIEQGYVDYKSRQGKRVSINFVCTDCHNQVREFDSEQENSPEARLDYARENGLKFLPASTFWGIYNRTSFYNGDYFKKYGELVINARDTLANAIQLCAKYCSSGRYLENWELEAILHYFKSNELHIEDLPLTAEDREKLSQTERLSPEMKQQLATRISGMVRREYPATFLPAMARNQRLYGKGGNVEKGKFIFENSCLYCHGGARVTYLDLNDRHLSARKFVRHLKDYDYFSLYQVIRYGTYPKTGRPQYMPLYTKEKMSDDQLNDLVAYIYDLANEEL